MMNQQIKVLKDAIFQSDIDEVKHILRENNFPLCKCLAGDLFLSGRLDEPTTLTLAVDSGHFDLVKKLLEFGGDCYTKGEKCYEYKGIPDRFVPLDYFAAMIHAAMVDRFDIIQLLAEYIIFNDTRTDSRYKDIVSSAKNLNFDCLELFLTEIEDKTTYLKGWKGHNLMNLLILHRCPTWCVELMMDHGIGVNGWDLMGLTPLRCAVLSKKLENVQLLLDKGADVYAPQLHGDTHFKNDGTFIDDLSSDLPQDSRHLGQRRTRLHRTGPSATMYAAAVRDTAILRLILDASPRHLGFHGTDGICGDAPLNFAIFYGCSESIALMLKYKAVRKSIGDAFTINLAMDIDNCELFELLLQNVIKWDPFNVCLCCRHCVSKNRPDYMARVLKKFYKKFRKEDKGGTLFRAIQAGSFEFANILFKLPDFDINTRYKFFITGICRTRFTALMYACYQGKDDFVRMLIEMGAKVDIGDKFGMTAIMLAAEESNVECFELLMLADADVNKVTVKGYTLFTFAMSGNGTCLEILLKSGKVFDQKTMKLKPVHKNALQRLSEAQLLRSFCTRNISLLMEYNIFEWDLCTKLPSILCDVAFAVVTLGVSPGKFKIETGTKAFQSSLLLYAHNQKDKATTRYLLANLFFLPEDYHVLCVESSMNNWAQSSDGSLEEDCLLELEPLLFQPLSLYQWSFLTISKAITICDSFSKDRSCRVDCLPLPATLRDELKFKRQYSRLCYRHWLNFGCQSRGDKAGISDLVAEGKVIRHITLSNCSTRYNNCNCGGLGQTFKID